MTLRIGTSCSASLDEMPRTPTGRHCTSCDRDVLDLRHVTEARAVAIALLLGGSAPCARLRVDARGEPVFRPPPRPVTQRRLPLVAVSAALAACGAPAAEAVEPSAPRTCALPPKTLDLALPAPGPADPLPPPVERSPREVAAQDTDADGVLDPADACPEEAAVGSADGCPPRRVVVESAGDLVILQQPRFLAGSTAFTPGTTPILDAAAQVLLEHPEIATLEIEGHRTGREAATLGAARAKAVADYLARRGVDRGRLRPLDAGATRPVAEGASADANALNRRVDLRAIVP